MSLNDINIDYGKNRYWKNHYWLFPPGSEVTVPNGYVSGVRLRPGDEASLADVRFRLCDLGYSHAEGKAKFEHYVHRWQRTGDELQIAYDEFHAALAEIDFAALALDDPKPYAWDFRAFVIDRLVTTERDEYSLEGFIYGLDFSVTLRTLCDRSDNLQLPVRWQTQDLIDQ